MSDVASVTQDFIFGTLATDELRLQALRDAGRGIFHGNQISPPDPEPDEPVALSVSLGSEADANRVFACYTLDGSEPDPEAGPRVEFARAETVWDTLAWGYRQEWQGVLPAQPAGTFVRYRIGAERDGEKPRWADPDPVTGRPATFGYHVDHDRVPDWVREAVIYQVFVDRFRPGGDRGWNDASSLSDVWGGTLRGVIEALPYLSELGVTCLWLSPVFPSPTHHGYDATDYFDVEPRLGSRVDLVELFEAAHARGMRVLLDFVANHVSNEHPVFRHALADRAAPERCWFTFTGEEYRTFFGVRSMPQIDVDHSAARRHLIDAAVEWLRLGADGFRLDYANGPSHAFWSEFRDATRAANPDSFTVGEVVETAELQRTYRGRLDGTLDFLLLQQIRAFFAFEATSAADFDRFLHRHLAFFPRDFVLPSFLDNHDMNRFLWVVGGDVRRLKLAALCQFTLPHPPIVYYGTEVGLSQRHDLEYPDGSRRMEESRTPMPWGEDQDAELRRFYTDLISLRRRYAGLWSGKRTTLAAEDDGLYVVAVERDDQSAAIAMNRGHRPREFVLPRDMSPGLATDVLPPMSRRRLLLPPYAGALLLAGADG
jgi:glycosidase